MSVSVFLIFTNTITLAPCQDGDVRLVGGQSAYEGQVEVCLSQRWGTVSSDGWSEYNSQVICNYFGFNPNGIEQLNESIFY